MDYRDERTCAQRAVKIAELNDRLRKFGLDGKIHLTRAVASQPADVIVALFRALRDFDAFGPENDPYGEHDFGSVTIADETFFWKIDCFNLALEFASPDAADETVTCRVLTLMAAEDM
jgi:hypothetical protein